MKKLCKLDFGVGAIAALLFIAIAVFVAIAMRSMMIEEAGKTIEGAVKAASSDIDTLIAGVESAVNNTAWSVREHLNDPKNAVGVTHALVEDNAIIVGSTVAFIPNYYPDEGQVYAHGRLYAPYAYRSDKWGILDASLRYDYLADPEQSAWFDMPMQTGKSGWCEPYFDDGGGDIMMCTYSVPIVSKDGKIVAVLTADVSLEDLTAHVSKVRPYADAYVTLHSQKGKTLVSAPDDVEEDNDDVTVASTTSNGWSLELVCPLYSILAGARRVVGYISLFSFMGLGLILFVSWVFTNRLQSATAARQRVESELAIANVIQSSMINVHFPDWAAAQMRPAKEVGGDRYDFAVRDGLAWFGIGDASGKGVPAALYTSLVGAGFRMGIGAGLNPAELVAAVNRLVAENNRTGMFVTAFVGCLSRATGRFDFCNAGHNPPVLIDPSGTVRALDVKRNLVMGALDDFAFKPQSLMLAPGSKIILYTDGVTEAMTAANRQYGMERLLSFAASHAHEKPSDIANALIRDVDAFVGDAPQSDDITVLVVSC